MLPVAVLVWCVHLASGVAVLWLRGVQTPFKLHQILLMLNTVLMLMLACTDARRVAVRREATLQVRSSSRLSTADHIRVHCPCRSWHTRRMSNHVAICEASSADLSCFTAVASPSPAAKSMSQHSTRWSARTAARTRRWQTPLSM
jgi:hypothetical protein